MSTAEYGRVLWTRSAQDDLAGALKHAGGPTALEAQRLAQAVADADRNLSRHPSLGRAGRQNGTREHLLVDLPFFIVYRQVDQVLEVLRFIHTSRQWPPRRPSPRKKR